MTVEGKTLAQLDDIEDVAKARFMIDTGAVLIGETTNYPNACISEAIDLLDRALARMNHRAPTTPDTPRQERWDRFAAAALTGIMSQCDQDGEASWAGGNAAERAAETATSLMAEADKRTGG